MKALLVIALVLVAGCSASAYDERQDARILDSLDDPALQNNPELLLSKCYELSDPAKRACYDEYLWAKEALGETVLGETCERLGIC